MNRDDIIRLRQEADDWAKKELSCAGEFHPDFHEVSDERFAALVAQECIDVLSDNEICSNHVSHALQVHFALSERTPQVSDKTEQRIKQQTTDYLDKCPNCGGPADNGFDRSWPDPNPYYCTKCMETGEY